MWTHYASDHRGLAVGFDRRHPCFSDAGELMRVEYLDRRVSISSNGGRLRIAGHVVKPNALPPLDLLLRKHPDWKYEKEWRWIVPLAHADETKVKPGEMPVCLKRFPTAAISAIVLGVRMEQHAGERVRMSFMTERWRHAKLYHARLSGERFALEFEAVATSA
jgi:hypothetical protein